MKYLKELLTDISKTARPEFRAIREAIKKGIEKGYIGRDFELREINTGAELFKKAGEALVSLSNSYRTKSLSQLEHAFYIILLIQLRSSILIKISTGLFIHTPLSHEMQRQLSSRAIPTENNTVSPASQADINKFYFLQVLYAFITVPKKNITLRKYFWLEMPGKTDRMNEVYKHYVIYLYSRKTDRIRWIAALSFLIGVGSLLYAFYITSNENNAEPSFLYPTVAPIFQREKATRNSDENNSSALAISFSQLYQLSYLAFSIVGALFTGLFIVSITLLSLDLHQINRDIQININTLIKSLIERWSEKFSGADRDFLKQLSTYDPGINDAATLVGLEERLCAIVEKPDFALSTNSTPPPPTSTTTQAPV